MIVDLLISSKMYIFLILHCLLVTGLYIYILYLGALHLLLVKYVGYISPVM